MNIDDAHAARIHARYLLGKSLDAEHDTTSYVDPGFVIERPGHMALAAARWGMEAKRKEARFTKS